MVRLALTIAALAVVASGAFASDADARRVKVALALSCSSGEDCPKKKVRDVLAETAPKSKEAKVREALQPIGLAPLPREKKRPEPQHTVCNCAERGGQCACRPEECACPECRVQRAEVPHRPFITPRTTAPGAGRSNSRSPAFVPTARTRTFVGGAAWSGFISGC